jgi:hypothetical protein
LRMASESFRTQLLAAIVKTGKIQMDTLEKKFAALTRFNITRAVRYLICEGYARKA